MSAGRVLVVDDDPQIRRTLRVLLTGQGFEVDEVRTGEAAVERTGMQRFDLVLLDMNMPGIGGFETCRRLRERSDIAIIMLTVRDAEVDKVAALDAGADDYVTKPFQPAVLVARMRAALRRIPSAQRPSGRLRLGQAEIDFDTRRVVLGDHDERLTPKEFDVLRFLMAHANRIVSHRELLQGVWGPDYGDEVDNLRVVMNQLRKKLEVDPSAPVFLLTEPWVGYRLQLPPS